MKGPFPAGTYKGVPLPQAAPEMPRLARDKLYRIVSPFRDADGDEHTVGETWAFLGSSFSHYDDLLTLFVRQPSGEEYNIPLVWDQQQDQRTIEQFEKFVEEVATSPLVCPKCSSAMEQGFVIEKAHGNRYEVSRWVPGRPPTVFLDEHKAAEELATAWCISLHEVRVR